jgi:hypothetical protein
LAGGSKIAASAANSRAERVISEIRAAESKARAKNEEFRGAREQSAQEFAQEAAAAKRDLAKYIRAHQILESEIADSALPADVREGLGDLSISPPPVIDLKRCTSGEAILQHSARVFIQGQNFQRSHPKAGGAIQAVAILGAVAGYIGANIEKIEKIDDFEGEARTYTAEIDALVASFDSAFQRDLDEDRKTAKRVGGFVRGLVRQANKSGAVTRSLIAVYAVAFSDYIAYLDGLVLRYRTDPEGGMLDE